MTDESEPKPHIIDIATRKPYEPPETLPPVDPAAPDTKSVECLAEALEMAEAGKISGAIIFAYDNETQRFQTWTNLPPNLEPFSIAAAYAVQAELLKENLMNVVAFDGVEMTVHYEDGDDEDDYTG